MCDNPFCDIEHDAAAADNERASQRAVPSSLRQLALAVAAGFGAVTVLITILSGAAVLRLWQVLPSMLGPPG